MNPVFRHFVSLLCVLALLQFSSGGHPDAQRQIPAGGPTPGAGQSATRLPDGRWLVLGGERAPHAARLWTADLRQSQGISGPAHARAWHTATLLPDGSVLVLGGTDASGNLVGMPERFDPTMNRFSSMERTAIGPRARHTATLLTDGRVLLIGGDAEPGALAAELWDPREDVAVPVSVSSPLPTRHHSAHLLPDGRVLVTWDDSPNFGASGYVFDPLTDTFSASSGLEVGSGPPAAVGFIPENGASGVGVDARLAARFGQPLDLFSLAAADVTLAGPDGLVPADIVAAGDGRLLFVTPRSALAPETTYTLNLQGLRTDRGASVVPARVAFTTAGQRKGTQLPPEDSEVWDPSSGRPSDDSPWRRLPPLTAPDGVTALAGQVLLLNGRPLADVTLEMEGHSTRTDRTGRFLLTLGDEPGGWCELYIDGRSANQGRRTFGIFEYGLSVVGGRTNVLPATIWMPVLDTAHAVRIDSPTAREVVITTPRIPGLELHLPRGTVITDEDGDVVRDISITPIPVDRPPFPLPSGVHVPLYFTIQPGGAYLQISGNGYGWKGAWLVYPNTTQQPAGQRLPFWSYDPEEKGWHVYGFGKVTPDGMQVRPDPGVELYEFSGAMIVTGGRTPPTPDPPLDGATDGEPVDLATGLFVMEKTDLFLPDVLPLALTRTYRNEDSAVRPFGIGSTHPYDLWFGNQETDFGAADLILPNGARIHFVKTSGTTLGTYVLEHFTTPTDFYGARLSYNGSVWELRLKDGFIYEFALGGPLHAIRDRFGNVITITRLVNKFGNIAKITAPHGRYIEFTYDTSDRITQAKDNSGRTVTYTYDTSGRLWKVTDAKGGVTEYTYNPAHRMLTIKDPRNILYLTNEYDTSGRLIRQTQADTGEYEFAYTLNGGQITQTDVTNPLGFVRRVAFNAARYPTSDIAALGQTVEQETTYSRLSGSQLVETATDELGRVTRLQYDAKGNVTSVTRLYGTSDAKTTSFAYDPSYSLVTSVTDPLSHATTYAYDWEGRLTSVTDPLSHQTTFTANGAGLTTSVTSALSKTTSFTYELGDQVGVTTPLGHSETRFVDTAGRLLRVTDARGAASRFEYDNLNQLTKIIDPLAGETTFTYDGNGNLLTLTDARSKTTTWTYDNMDQIATRTDPLSRQESFSYDLNGNLKTWTDRGGQVSSYSYDALDRQTFVGFGTTGTPPTYASTIATTYDAGNRPTSMVDSVAGTITSSYDLLDRVTSEVTPEGTIAYTYDGASRRATATVTGQTAVSYSFDNGDRVTGVTRGTASVAIAYDNGDRRTSLTLPNGIVVEYGYDDDSRLTGLTYKQGGSTIGTLTYVYDANGQRTSMGGSYARTGLPAALTSATYDNANQIATWAGGSFTYDSNGNLTGDGTRSYTWNARNELASLSGPVNASFAYDAFGRRRNKTVGGTTTQFLYDGQTPVQELSGGTPTANLLTGLGIDEYFTRTDVAGVRNYLTDGLGSSLALADGSGTIQTEYTYEPFGGTSTSGASTGNTFVFTGREADGTGLYFYRARYYDPKTTDFVSEDPISFGGGLNLYDYVGSDPINWIDPLGLQKIYKPPYATEPSFPRSINPFSIADQVRKWRNPHDKADTYDNIRHCITNCLLTRSFGAAVAWYASRLHDPPSKRDPDSLSDHRANRRGRCLADRYPQQPCVSLCIGAFLKDGFR
jgi:RHS repeat-associated protein